MFFSIFNYVKLVCWGGLFFLNYRYTKKCNLDILNIILYNIQKTNILAVKCIQKIIPYLKLIDYDKEIVEILSQTYENNIYHSDKTTLQIYKKDFKKDFTDEYKIVDRISSGSIGQVYKISKGDEIFAMKVIHPDVKYHLNFINKMIYLFDLKKYFFDLDEFIKNFTDETNFIKESENMRFFYDNYKDNDHIIIPKVYKSSENIIIMEYIEGEKIIDLNSYERSKYLMLSILFCNNNKFLLNYNHGDMHFGNFKKHSYNKLVVYDYGFCFRVLNKKIINILESFYYNLCNNPLANIDYTYLECVEYLVYYHLDSSDSIENYRDDINELFIENSIESLGDLAVKSYTFFIKNNIKVKLEYLNLIINYYYSSEINDCYLIDLLSFAQTYNIFNDYQEILKKQAYAHENSIEKNKDLYDELKNLM